MLEDEGDIRRVRLGPGALDDVVDADQEADEAGDIELGQLVADEVGRGVAVDPEIGDELEPGFARTERTHESTGQRSARATDVPMVYESPSAT